MDTGMLNMKTFTRQGLLYPMLVIAAVSVIIFSALGVATITGILPRAESVGDAQVTPASRDRAADKPAATARSRAADNPANPARSRVAQSRQAECADCGVVESITPVEVKGSGSGLGMIAGGVTGALVGNQIGRGNGNAVATIAGAAGGAFAGNEIEKNMKKAVRYAVRLQMSDGTYRTIHQSSAPAFGVGEKVRIVNGQITAAG